MAIINITNANTFGQWLSTTQSLVSVANSLTDGPTLTANTLLRLTHAGETLNVANTAIFTGNIAVTGSGYALNVSNSVYIGGDLLVGGNVTLDAIGFDNLTVSGNTTIAETLTVPNVFFTTAFANSGSIQVYNATVLNTATVNVLSGNAVAQFDATGTGIAMAIALG